ncbi:hypothetical protein [Pseudobacillus wudalianchiensis]|uniref:Uncharacterized protein n=1 Tax=Pseudobacillus wudalianchiensis TaxID=1743143 RepID=A0A1B9B8Z7_9BACI|nr:hypothetical protein [Bacillus wudalianchiensis]OCA92559.1 hypothetical protein A8F95_02350 [Bacillus wudalianchiensis]
MSSIQKWIVLFICSIIANVSSAPFAYGKEDLKIEINKLENRIKKYGILLREQEKRLKNLEPSEPVRIDDPPWAGLSLPSHTESIRTVIKTGPRIPFKTIIDKPDYKRAAYEKYWHSTTGRWSYMPIRIHYALHRLFTNYDIGLSEWYDFEHNVGLSIPMFQNEKALDMYIVIFQTKVTDVYTKGNQIVVVGVPQRTGAQVITITTKNVEPINKREALLVQLATQAGQEIDYSLISYVPPDFWSKQKKNLKDRTP